MRALVSARYLLFVLNLCAVGVFGATMDNLHHEKPLNVAVEQAPPSGKDLAGRIEKTIRDDPLFGGVRTDIDVYRGLVVVHGSAPNEEMASVLNDRLSHTPGVLVVYNYMTTPANPAPAGSIAVSYDSFTRLAAVGMSNASLVLGDRVRDRLAASNETAPYDIGVDSYMGLVILNGRVDDPHTAVLAKSIAEHTEGVQAVLSYLSASPYSFETAPVTIAPVEIRPYVSEPLPEPITVSVPECSTCQ